MKTLLTLCLLLLFSTCGKAQENVLFQIDSLGNYYRVMEGVRFPFDTASGKITYSEVVEVKGQTAQQLYLRAKEWYARVFNSGKAVIDLDDNVNFKLIGKGQTAFVFKNTLGGEPGGEIHYSITLMAKDGRYKYIITDIYHNGNGKLDSGGLVEAEKWPKGAGNLWNFRGNWAKYKLQANTDALFFISSIKEHMAKAAIEDKW